MDNQIEFTSSISAEDFCSLRESVGFQHLTIEQAQTVLANTALIVHAICDGESAGMIRVLTDTLTDAYITDVIVNPAFQGQGLGRKLLDQVLSALKERSVANVKLACSLYANPGKEPFYEKFGFETLPNDSYGYGMLLEL